MNLSISVMDKDSEEPHKGIIVFGRDLTKIPCFRNTFLYSISSYFGVSLLTFLFTSRPTFSSHCGFASFVAVTFGYYTNCTINYTKQKFEYGQLQGAWQKYATLEGIEEADKKKPVLEDV